MRTLLDCEESSDQERKWECQDPPAGARQAGSANRKWECQDLSAGGRQAGSASRKWECPDLPAGGRQARLPQARDIGDPDIDLI